VRLSDLGLHATISAAIRAAIGVAGADVTVLVRDGVVTLAGVVDTQAEKLAAERAAQRVPGVHAVAEELRVRSMYTPPVTDEMLARRALVALAAGASSIGNDVTIRVENGWMSLGGTVVSQAEYTAVEQALECLPGVRGMTSEVGVAHLAEHAPVVSGVR
jgi:osmotically-inducible protein OsmY